MDTVTDLPLQKRQRTHPLYAFEPHRNRLYDAGELLLNTDATGETLDQRIAKSYAAIDGGDQTMTLPLLLARQEHDTRVMFAAKLYLQGKRVVAFMGGHSLKRDSPGYASCARIARDLARKGFTIMAGGGPGAMEAAMLGCHFAAIPQDDKLLDALQILSQASSHLDPTWFSASKQVLERFPRTLAQQELYPSLSVPTWLYEQEPTNVFATKIAKVFQNSIREEFLVSAATEGVVFFPGSMGTIQEMFMVGSMHHYNLSKAPMVFFDKKYWKETTPVFPLLEGISTKFGWVRFLSIHDEEEKLVEEILLKGKSEDNMSSNHPSASGAGGTADKRMMH